MANTAEFEPWMAIFATGCLIQPVGAESTKATV